MYSSMSLTSRAAWDRRLALVSFAAVLALLMSVVPSLGLVAPAAAATPVPGEQVIVGLGQRVVDGVNTARGVDDLIVYTRTGRQTVSPANQWGTEAAVVGGKVTAVRNRNSGGAAMAIPDGGFVLSGHGESQAWLNTHATIGASVSTPVPAEPVSGQAVQVGLGQRVVDGVNTARGVDDLVVYTRTASQAVSPANQWGTEAAVVGGKVTAVRNRNSGGAAMAIPAGGFVLSGHGASQVWLDTHATIGASVSTASGTAPGSPPPNPSPSPSPSPSPDPLPGGGTNPVLGRVAGVYWTGWSPDPGLVGLPSGFNVAYLFAAHRTSGGRVAWGYARPDGIEAVRARGVKVILSTGGAGSGISFTSRAMSTEFVDSVEAISASWGGTRERPAFDGVDFNTFEADAVPNTGEYLWMAQELKRRFGAGFLVTSPPAPWKAADREFARTMLAAGAMDYVAPQYYDGPGLADPGYIAGSVRSWVRDVAGGDASRVVVGFGVSPGSANYSTTAQVRAAWDQIEAEFPAIRGAFVWSHTGDQANGWGFATTITPLIHS